MRSFVQQIVDEALANQAAQFLAHRGYLKEFTSEEIMVLLEVIERDAGGPWLARFIVDTTKSGGYASLFPTKAKVKLLELSKEATEENKPECFR